MSWVHGNLYNDHWIDNVIYTFYEYLPMHISNKFYSNAYSFIYRTFYRTFKFSDFKLYDKFILKS